MGGGLELHREVAGIGSQRGGGADCLSRLAPMGKLEAGKSTGPHGLGMELRPPPPQHQCWPMAPSHAHPEQTGLAPVSNFYAGCGSEKDEAAWTRQRTGWWRWRRRCADPLRSRRPDVRFIFRKKMVRPLSCPQVTVVIVLKYVHMQWVGMFLRNT